MRVVVDPDREEALELSAAGVDHAEGCIAGSGQLRRGRYEPLEKRLERQFGCDRRARLEQRPEAALARSNGPHGRQRIANTCGKPTSGLRSSPDAACACTAQCRVDRKES